jgi:hypothetical protein
MTERTDGARHPLTADTLADLQEGLLDADGEAAARRHLEACAACRADLAALTELPARLAAAGDAGPVPELVAARVERALADAAEEAGPAAVPTAARTVTPMAPDRGPVRGMRLLQAAAAVVLVLGVGALGVSALTQGGGSGGGDSATSAAGGSSTDKGGVAAEAATAPITTSGRDWTAQTLAAAAPALVAGSLGPAYSAYDRQAAPQDSAGSPGASATPAPSAADVPAPLAAAAGDAARLAYPGPLRACVANITDGDPSMQPLAVDLARWQGQPAAVLVFPTEDDQTTLDVYVVAPDCPTGLFLHFARVPRS